MVPAKKGKNNRKEELRREQEPEADANANAPHQVQLGPPLFRSEDREAWTTGQSAKQQKSGSRISDPFCCSKQEVGI